MTFNPYMRTTFLDRLKGDAPHLQDVRDTINKIGDVAEQVVNVSKKLEGDRNLTEAGKVAKLSEFVRTRGMVQFAFATHRARVAPAYLRSQKDGLSLPKFDRQDLAGEMQRAELRTYLRSLPQGERISLAANNPLFADALLDMPAAVSGIDPHTFERIKVQRVRDVHGNRLDELDRQIDDYSNAESMAAAVRHELQKVSGLSREGFDAEMKPLEDGAA